MYLYDPTTGKWYTYEQDRGGDVIPDSGSTGGTGGITDPRGETPVVTSPNPVPNPLTELPSTQAAPAPGALKLVPGGSASDNLANLTNAQWQDYIRRFVPIEDTLIKSTSYGNPEVLTQAIATGRNAVNKAYDTAAQTQQRAISQYGLTQDADQRAVSNRVNNLNKSASVVDAANKIRARIADRNRQIAVGGTPSSGISAGG